MSLRAGELASIRRAYVASMPSTCVIARTAAGTADPFGGTSEGTATTYGTVVCGAGPLGSPRPIFQPAGGGAEVFVTFAIRFPVGTDVQPGDDVTVNGEVFRVQQVDTARSQPLEVRALCTGEAS